MSKTALVFGASGLIGTHLVDLLSVDPKWAKVITVVRRSQNRDTAKVQEILADATTISNVADQLVADTAFCCLGTTHRKAGSHEAFRRIDHDFVLDCAKTAKSQGVKRFVLVSSMGANVHSPSRYAKVKGETERDLIDLGFDATDILRPSLLLGNRPERRFAEDIGGRLAPALSLLLFGPLRAYRPIHARDVAKAMLQIAQMPGAGVTVHESDHLTQIAKTAPEVQAKG